MEVSTSLTAPTLVAMTWWAALLGFVGALAGSWGGQIIASKREDRRWERERQREDVRWSREADRDRERHEHDLEKLARQLTHTAQSEWRSERVVAYQSFLDAFDAWQESAEPFVASEGNGMPGAAVSKLIECLASLKSSSNRLEIIGSQKIKQEIDDEIMQDAVRATWAMAHAYQTATEGGEVHNTKFREMLDKLEKSRASVVELVRVDVLISSEESAQTAVLPPGQ